MMSSMMVKADQISRDVEACARELMDKLCEGEPDGMSAMAWAMMTTRMLTSCAWGSCFQLPPLEEV